MGPLPDVVQDTSEPDPTTSARSSSSKGASGPGRCPCRRSPVLSSTGEPASARPGARGDARPPLRLLRRSRPRLPGHRHHPRRDRRPGRAKGGVHTMSSVPYDSPDPWHVRVSSSARSSGCWCCCPRRVRPVVRRGPRRVRRRPLGRRVRPPEEPDCCERMALPPDAGARRDPGRGGLRHRADPEPDPHVRPAPPGLCAR